MCEVSSTDVALEEFFSDSNICLFSLRDLESMGKSTGISLTDLSVVPLTSFPYFQVEEQMIPLEHYQVDFSTSHSWFAPDRGIEPLCDWLAPWVGSLCTNSTILDLLYPCLYLTQGFVQGFVLGVVHIVEFEMFVNFVDFSATILSNL